MCFASKIIQFTIANMKMIIYTTVNGHQFSSVLPLIILLIIYYFLVCFTILHKRLSMVKGMKIGDHLQWCKWSFSCLLWWIGSFCLQNTWNEIFQNITSFFWRFPMCKIVQKKCWYDSEFRVRYGDFDAQKCTFSLFFWCF